MPRALRWRSSPSKEKGSVAKTMVGNAREREAFDGLQRRAAARAAAERGDEKREAHARQMWLQRGDGVLRREAGPHDVAAGPQARQSFAAQEDETLVGDLRRRGVGVERDVAEGFAEGAKDAAHHARARRADADEEERVRAVHLKSLLKRPPKRGVSSDEDWRA